MERRSRNTLIIIIIIIDIIIIIFIIGSLRCFSIPTPFRRPDDYLLQEDGALLTLPETQVIGVAKEFPRESYFPVCLRATVIGVARNANRGGEPWQAGYDTEMERGRGREMGRDIQTDGKRQTDRDRQNRLRERNGEGERERDGKRQTDRVR